MTSAATRGEMLSLLERLPVDGLLPRSSVRPISYRTFDGLYHNGSCEEITKLSTAEAEEALGTFPVSEVITNHHHTCLSARFGFHSDRHFFGVETHDLTRMIEIHELLTKQLDQLETPPADLTEAFNRLRSPFTFGQREGFSMESTEPRSPFRLNAAGWKRQYLAEYSRRIDLSVKIGRSLPVEGFAIEVDEYLHSTKAFTPEHHPDPTIRNLICVRNFPSFLAEEITYAPGELLAGSTRAAVKALFSTPRDDFLIAPSSVADLLRVPPSQRAEVDDDLSEATLETLEVLFDPSSDGAYSTLSAALAAATRL